MTADTCAPIASPSVRSRLTHRHRRTRRPSSHRSNYSTLTLTLRQESASGRASSAWPSRQTASNCWLALEPSSLQLAITYAASGDRHSGDLVMPCIARRGGR
jgi:hypothetical protein